MKLRLFLLLGSALIFTSGCGVLFSAFETRRELAAAMDRYNAGILASDADALAALYAPDGVLGNGADAVTGPENIAKFLHQFDNYAVIRQDATITAIQAEGDTGTVSGTYVQEVRVSSNHTQTVCGLFQADYIRQDGAWLVQQMRTTPRPC